eukprot:TRINITY_DN1384_c0_g1_i1.p1 TRINITY_DN1384_c0_g1~~TRINITY_DN1384_c0_g1_i1.p1  ORF type:complete len:176 (-),score=7.79 TRINITY_DN1384_c0_g1_i1:238-765(-)
MHLNTINLSSDISKSPTFHVMAMQSQIFDLMTQHTRTLMDLNTGCYRIKKLDSESNMSYISKVGKCHDAWIEHYETVDKNNKVIRQRIIDAQSESQAKLLNCLNLVNDHDIDACKRNEYEFLFNKLRAEYLTIQKELDSYKKSEVNIKKLAETKQLCAILRLHAAFYILTISKFL